jgi:RNA polymerase sigma-B factor
MNAARAVLRPGHARSAVPELPESPSSAAPRSEQHPVDAVADSEGDEYTYLEPLLADYVTMAPDDPRRARLRNQLITGYLPVAGHIAQRYARRGQPVEDLTQVATVGLIQAFDRFDPEHGGNFLGYAIPTMTGEVRRYFRDKTWSMRVPRRLKDLHLSINSAVRELSQHLDRAPRPSEIAAKLGVSIEDVLESLEASQSYATGSLDALLTAENGAVTHGDLFGASDPEFDRFTDSHSLAPHLAALPERERSILIMRFYDDMTQSQIGARLGISQMQVSRLLAATLARLRDDTLGPRSIRRHEGRRLARRR